MNSIAELGLGMAGFLIGNLVFSKIARWLATIHAISKSQDPSPKAVQIASATLLNSGPWFAIAVGVFAYYAHSKAWALPIFIGAVVALLYVIGLGLYVARKIRQRRNANAA